MNKEKLEYIKKLKAITEVQEYYLEKLDLLPPEITYISSKTQKNGKVVHIIDYDDQPYKINLKQNEVIEHISSNYKTQNYTFYFNSLVEEVDFEHTNLYKLFRHNQDLYKKLFTSLGNGKWKMNIK